LYYADLNSGCGVSNLLWRNLILFFRLRPNSALTGKSSAMKKNLLFCIPILFLCFSSLCVSPSARAESTGNEVHLKAESHGSDSSQKNKIPSSENPSLPGTMRPSIFC
jgi:hypothetical protein